MRLRPLTPGLILSLALTQSFAQSRQTVTGTIEVRVTESEGKPLERVSVRLIPFNETSDKTAETTSTTDSSGRAIFRGLPFDQYSVVATRRGYREREFDAHPAGSWLSVDESSRSHVVRLRLVPESIIAGRVHDANGRPLPGTTVTLLKISHQIGLRFLNASNSAPTNDRGEYRIFGLAAGEYYVRIDNPNDGTDEAAAFISRTYYPGTNDLRYATPVVLKEGQESGGINLDVKPASKGVTLSGTVINLQSGGEPQADGSVARPIRMFMIPAHDGPAEAVWLPIPKADSNSETHFPFEIRNVPSGEYLLYAMFNDRTMPKDADCCEPPKFFTSRVKVEVDDKDLGNLTITMDKGAEIRGRLTVHGEDALNPGFHIRTYSGPNAVEFRSLARNLPSSYGSLIGFPGYLQDGDTFRIPNLLEGRYQLAYMWARSVSQTDYLEDLRQDGRSIYNDGIVTLGTSSAEVEIVVNRNGGRIRGTVDIPLDEPGYVSVVLVPEAPRRTNPVLYRSAPMNADRTFSLKGVAPGNYKLFAFVAFPRGAETNPEFLAPYEQRGIAVTARAGVEVQAAPVPINHLK